MSVQCTLRVNGHPIQREVDPRVSLADLLREELGLTGTHLGCEHGVCGACTVLINGNSVRGCLVLAVQADGEDVVTIEGLHDDPDVRLLAGALSARHGLQCGFCTPGVIVTAMELLRSGEAVDETTVRERLSGNLCRCTGYQGIVAAVLEAANDLSCADHPAPRVAQRTEAAAPSGRTVEPRP